MTGYLDILNTGAGDIRISFYKGNKSEVNRAKEIIQDSLLRGYALLVEGEGGKMERAVGFDPKTNEYILASPGTPVPEADEVELMDTPTGKRIRRRKKGAKQWSWVDMRSAEGRRLKAHLTGKPARRRTRYRRSLQGSRATAIAPSAGG